MDLPHFLLYVMIAVYRWHTLHHEYRHSQCTVSIPKIAVSLCEYMYRLNLMLLEWEEFSTWLSLTASARVSLATTKRPSRLIHMQVTANTIITNINNKHVSTHSRQASIYCKYWYILTAKLCN